MMRASWALAVLLSALAILTAGCVSNMDAAAALTPEQSAALACECALAVVAAGNVAPVPVVPSGVCQRCGGKGYVGDTASIRIRCDACKGTGKSTACTTGTCGVRR